MISLQVTPGLAPLDHRDVRLGNPIGLRDLALKSCIFTNGKHLLWCQFFMTMPTLVVGLFQARSPTAVVRKISEVVICPLQGQPWWRLAHVSKEVLKRAPTLASSDSASAVVRIGRTIKVRTTLKHIAPSSVCWRSVMTMFAVQSLGALCVQAFARFRLAGAEVATRYNATLAAVTLAEPIDAFGAKSDAQNGQSTEPFAGYILESGHRGFSYERRVKSWRSGVGALDRCAF